MTHNSSIDSPFRNGGLNNLSTSGWSNYISHSCPPRDNFINWYNAYLSQLIHIESIVTKIIQDNLPNSKIRWDAPQIFLNLIRLIYHCSSKYITPHLTYSSFEEE